VLIRDFFITYHRAAFWNCNFRIVQRERQARNKFLLYCKIERTNKQPSASRDGTKALLGEPRPPSPNRRLPCRADISTKSDDHKRSIELSCGPFHRGFTQGFRPTNFACCQVQKLNRPQRMKFWCVRPTSPSKDLRSSSSRLLHVEVRGDRVNESERQASAHKYIAAGSRPDFPLRQTGANPASGPV
jgi:hypothetical protein